MNRKSRQDGGSGPAWTRCGPLPFLFLQQSQERSEGRGMAQAGGALRVGTTQRAARMCRNDTSSPQEITQAGAGAALDRQHQKPPEITKAAP